MTLKGRKGTQGLTKNDIARKLAAYDKKTEEYAQMTLQELRDLYNHPDKSKRPGGMYKIALAAVVEYKLNEEKRKNLKEAIADIKELEPEGVPVIEEPK